MPSSQKNQPQSQKQSNEWRTQIKQARSRDYKKLSRLLNDSLKQSNEKAHEKFSKELKKSLALVQELKNSTPKIEYPGELPISQRRDEIADLIKNNQIVILAGETGSGKTTQLPKICLELGYGARGLIGHTQPRRIAARTVADRIASELKTTLGETVGYQVRFKDQSSQKTQVKLMTDGVLLAEIQNDRLLSRYEVIIIDEAHERSLNIDFLLGLLKPLCKKRPDLKIIITSATIDLEKFSQHFSLNGKPAPIIEVSGRTYPVEVVYQDTEESSLALEDEITLSVEQVIKAEQQGLYKAQGDILVFCSGERDIRETAKALRRANLNLDILPLYARLSVAEQNKVFKPAAKRKVVLATNVAETSITVPGIAYVIDPGLARISRYSFRSKVQRLPIEEISQASADQRKGRCGRVANGVCIRLYSEENFSKRAEFTPAEILRSNLASVILQMRRLGIKDIEHFDFIDTPDSRLLNDGIKLLQELNAIDKSQQLTTIGKQLSVIPVDPRYARILAEANKHACLRDALVVISVLSIQDPRERPAEFRQKADEKHRATQHSQSDFFSYLYLWQLINNKREELTNAQFKKYCSTHFLSISRIFEWRELYRQLATVCKELKWKNTEWQELTLPELNAVKEKLKSKVQFDNRYINLHKSLLCGLLSNIATKDLEKDYLATRNRKVNIFPGSSLSKRPSKQQAKWILAAEFLETSRLFLHTVAEIEPEWVIESATHLCKYSYSDPKYNGQSGIVNAQRKTLLSGLVLRENERVNYAAINPKEARELFIQRGLVDGLYQYKAKKTTTDKKQLSFSKQNQKLITEIKKLETKTRKHNLLVSDELIYNFYASKIPETIVSRSTFEKWYKVQEVTSPNLLLLKRSDLLQNDIDAAEVAQFPNFLNIQGKKLKLQYTFDPNSEADGVTLLVPHNLLEPLPENVGTWLVPGLLKEKCIALLKTLPKTLRKQLVPINNTVDSLIPTLEQNDSSLGHELCKQILRSTGVEISPKNLDKAKLDAYYQMNYRVVKQDGSTLAQSRNLVALKKRYADTVKASIQKQSSTQETQFELHNLKQWDFGELPESISYQHQGMKVTAFPMLKVEKNDSISLLLSYSKELASYHTKRGLIKLSQIQSINGNQKQSYQYLQKELFKNNTKQNKQGLASLADQLKKSSKSDSNYSVWRNEVIDAALWESCFADLDDIPRNEDKYHESLKNARQWVSNALSLEKIFFKALQKKTALEKRIAEFNQNSKETTKALLDMHNQLDTLFEKHILRYTDVSTLKHYQRYLQALEIRLDKLNSATADSNITALYDLESKFKNFIQNELVDLNAKNTDSLNLEIDALYHLKPQYFEYATLLQEWRVSIFAQQLKTAVPVSRKRLLKASENLLN